MTWTAGRQPRRWVSVWTASCTRSILVKRNAAALRKAMAEFVDHARRVKATRTPGPGRAGKRPVPRSGPAPAVVREWAAGQGITVSARGRIPADVVARYEAAHA